LVHDPYLEFRQAVDRGEDKIDLGRAALTIALFEYPDLDIAAYVARIDGLAVEVSRRAGGSGDVYKSIAALNHVLFEKHGFRGNRDEYYDPKNSFLNEVLDRKTGIPITLSILYMEVAQRAGLALDGVGFPGHFLVKHARDNGVEIVIDPFQQGEIKSRDDLARMLRRVYGGAVELRDEFLQTSSKREIVRRILGNLRGIYSKTNDLVRLLSVLDRAIILQPSAAEEIRERATVYLRLDCFVQARADFETYLRLAPQAKDAGAVREQLIDLARQVTLIH
jgi:regulator of sirC expression with transglutaminase-like and TPR domain